MTNDKSPSTKFNKIASSITLLLLIASVVLNVFLAQKVRELTTTINDSRAEMRLDEGETVPILKVNELTGKTITISFSEISQPTILYIFTPQCHWCFENLDNLKILEKQSQGKFRLIGLSLNKDELENYIQKNGIDFPIYTVSTEVQSVYKFGGTPQTLVVSPDGKVIKNWTGIYVDEVGSEVESYFNFKLTVSKKNTALLEVQQ
jgi:peroxiredoxin